jgi:glycosyltransferase involved in cell wall biosynthesis
LKILHLSTYDTFGGAAIAALRTHEALVKAGLENDFLVQKQSENAPYVHSLSDGYLQKKLASGRFAWERLAFLPFEKDKSVRFAFSPADVGMDISHRKIVLQADILHLHWINFGFLSLKNIRQLLDLQKPVVWTLYDMWAFTGGCHYSAGCLNFQTHCHDCPFLKNPSANDLSYRVFEKKIKLFEKANLHIVGCSEWLAKTARSSFLLKNFPVHRISTPINTDVFKQTDPEKARRKWHFQAEERIVLFGAMNTQDPRKGFVYLLEALRIFKEKFPDQAGQIRLAVFGKTDEKMLETLPLPYINLGKLPVSQLVEIYSAADVLVMPSLEDNLPNVVTEALACSLPVVGFRSGGVPEMIDHLENGFLAQSRSAEELAEGIEFVLFRADAEKLSRNARRKAEAGFGEKKVAEQYLELYRSL